MAAFMKVFGGGRVPDDQKIYVNIDGKGGFIYSRFRNGVEQVLTDDDADEVQGLCFYSSAAIEQVKRLTKGV